MSRPPFFGSSPNQWVKIGFPIRGNQLGCFQPVEIERAHTDYDNRSVFSIDDFIGLFKKSRRAGACIFGGN